MTEPSTVIHVVDDDPPFRNAIARLLRASGYEVALYESGEQFLKNPPGANPGCILLDIQMSGINGLQVQDHLAELDVILPVVFLTGHGDIPDSVKAIKAGAENFLTKPVSKATLLEAVERAMQHHTAIREQHDRLSDLRQRVAKLTSRESEVFALVVRGRLNKRVAYDLGMSERTVKAHRHSIMQKLQVRSLAEAVSIAERLGLLSGAEIAVARSP